MITDNALLQDLKVRTGRITDILRQNGLDAVLITSFVNVFYTTGRIFDGYIYIPVNGAPWYFVRRPVGVEGDNVIYIGKPEEIPDLLRQRGVGLPENLSIEYDEISAREWNRLKRVFNGCIIDTKVNVLRKARSVKTLYELEGYKILGRMHAEAFEKIPALYKPGMTDLDFSAEIEYMFRKSGHLGIFRTFGMKLEAFMGTILAGDNALAPSPYDFAVGGQGQHPSFPVGISGNIIKDGTSVMVDISGNFNGYLTDMTRTYSVGTIPGKAYDIHNTALEIQNTIAEKGVPGVQCSDLYQLSLNIADKYGLSDCFMGLTQQAKFTGHGVGLEINEQPVITSKDNTLLEEGMVIALEPKFLIRGVGAVGIEDTFIVGTKGFEKITTLNDDIVKL